MDNWAIKMGWNTDSLLALALEYIDRQGSDDAFEDFLAHQAGLEDQYGIITDPEGYVEWSVATFGTPEQQARFNRDEVTPDGLAG